jgi:hypothetical protein
MVLPLVSFVDQESSATSENSQLCMEAFVILTLHWFLRGQPIPKNTAVVKIQYKNIRALVKLDKVFGAANAEFLPRGKKWRLLDTGSADDEEEDNALQLAYETASRMKRARKASFDDDQTESFRDSDSFYQGNTTMESRKKIAREETNFLRLMSNSFNDTE